MFYASLIGFLIGYNPRELKETQRGWAHVQMDLGLCEIFFYPVVFEISYHTDIVLICIVHVSASSSCLFMYMSEMHACV